MCGLCVERSERSCVAPPALWSLDSFLVPRCTEIVEGLLWVTGIRKCGGCTSGLKDRTPTQSMANSEISNSGVEKRGSKRRSRGVRLFSLVKIPISLCLQVGQRHGMMSVVRCGIDRPTLPGLNSRVGQSKLPLRVWRNHLDQGRSSLHSAGARMPSVAVSLTSMLVRSKSRSSRSA